MTFCSPWQTRSTSNHLNWPIVVELVGPTVFSLTIIMAPRLAMDTIFTSQITRIATPTLTQTSVTRIKHHRDNRLTFFWPERIALYQAKLKHFTFQRRAKMRRTKLLRGKFLWMDICLVELTLKGICI